MPIPFILGGLALAAAGYGAKKTYDAYEDNSTAEYNNEKAKKIYDEAQSELNEKRINTNAKLEELGALKLKIYKNSLQDFVDIYSKIENVEMKNNLDLGLKIADSDFKNILEIKNDILKITELAGATTAALGGGALAGLGAFGGAGLLATASTGTAIGTLSGVAATNATLAWFGGGSLAAGGLGMAGGMAILGGIVAGPILAIAGGIFAAKAETAKHESYANLDKAKAYAEEMKIAQVIVEEIKQRVEEFITILKSLESMFENYLDKLDSIIDRNRDYLTYNISEQEIVCITESIAITVKNVCDAPIIDENGKITRKSRRILEDTNEFLTKLKEI